MLNIQFIIPTYQFINLRSNVSISPFFFTIIIITNKQNPRNQSDETKIKHTNAQIKVGWLLFMEITWFGELIGISCFFEQISSILVLRSEYSPSIEFLLSFLLKFLSSHQMIPHFFFFFPETLTWKFTPFSTSDRVLLYLPRLRLSLFSSSREIAFDLDIRCDEREARIDRERKIRHASVGEKIFQPI